MTTKRLVKRFSILGVMALGVAVAIAFVFVSKHFAIGVLVGGVLGLVNVRGLARGVSGMDINNPRPARMFFGGGVRLIILCLAIVLIAMTKKVDLVGLLLGFTVELVVVMVAGAFEVKALSKEESDDSPQVITTNNSDGG
jgi:hypothetical protein